MWRSSPAEPPEKPAPVHRALAAVLLCALVLPATARAQDPAADRLFREARRLEEAGDPQAALEEFQLLVQQFPDDELAPQGAASVDRAAPLRGR